MVYSLLNSSRHTVRSVYDEENSIFEKTCDFEFVAINAHVSLEISKRCLFSNLDVWRGLFIKRGFLSFQV